MPQKAVRKQVMRQIKNNFPPKANENKPLCCDKDKEKEELHPKMKKK